MKKFTQKFIGLLALVFLISFNTHAQDNYSLSFDGEDTYVNLDSINLMNPLNDSFSFFG